MTSQKFEDKEEKIQDQEQRILSKQQEEEQRQLDEFNTQLYKERDKEKDAVARSQYKSMNKPPALLSLSAQLTKTGLFNFVNKQLCITIIYYRRAWILESHTKTVGQLHKLLFEPSAIKLTRTASAIKMN